MSVKCSACGNDVDGESVNHHLPDVGFVLPYQEFGYYGGFTDTFDDYYEKPREWLMCHDCVVKLLETFPLLAQTIPRGEHPCDREIPCCNWAWRSHEDGLQFGKDGQWVND